MAGAKQQQEDLARRQGYGRWELSVTLQAIEKAWRWLFGGDKKDDDD